MEKDEIIPESEQVEETGDELEAENPEEGDEDKPKGVDYRGKLNATNNFLKKEGYVYKDGKWVKEDQKTTSPARVESTAANAEPQISPKDLYAMQQANVHIDDFDEVQEAAKVLKLPIRDALKHPVVASLLNTKMEHRKTADSANTKAARQGAKKMSDAEILERANRGEIPEPGTPEAEALWRARRGIK